MTSEYRNDSLTDFLVSGKTNLRNLNATDVTLHTSCISCPPNVPTMTMTDEEYGRALVAELHALARDLLDVREERERSREGLAEAQMEFESLRAQSQQVQSRNALQMEMELLKKQVDAKKREKVQILKYLASVKRKHLRLQRAAGLAPEVAVDEDEEEEEGEEEANTAPLTDHEESEEIPARSNSSSDNKCPVTPTRRRRSSKKQLQRSRSNMSASSSRSEPASPKRTQSPTRRSQSPSRTTRRRPTRTKSDQWGVRVPDLENPSADSENDRTAPSRSLSSLVIKGSRRRRSSGRRLEPASLEALRRLSGNEASAVARKRLSAGNRDQQSQLMSDDTPSQVSNVSSISGPSILRSKAIHEGHSNESPSLHVDPGKDARCAAGDTSEPTTKTEEDHSRTGNGTAHPRTCFRSLDDFPSDDEEEDEIVIPVAPKTPPPRKKPVVENWVGDDMDGPSIHVFQVGEMPPQLPTTGSSRRLAMG